MTTLFPLRLSAATLSLSLFLCFAGGCAKPVNFETWRSGVERYVREQGGGDPAVLRELQATPSHRGFRMMSADRPSESTDAVGLLVGSARVSGRPWIVFLVGLVDEQKVKDIRLAALSVQNNQYIWRMGSKDGKAVEAYRNHNRGLAHRRFPQRRREPVEYLGFPREEDRFELSTQDDSIGVSHPPSGARWDVRVGPLPSR